MAQRVESNAYQLMLKGLLSNNVETIDVDKAAQLKNCFFIDAREEKEFKVSHIKNAFHIGYETPDFNVLDKIDKNDSIIVYCSVGYRSEKITQKLNQMGYKNVYNLYGGLFEWVNQGWTIYQEKSKTNKVHAYNKVWGIWLNKGEKVYD